jgi:trehalose 6-phosphate phosphatase
VLCQPAREFLPMISEVRELLAAKVEDIPGAKVEDNKFCLSVHFRCVGVEVCTLGLASCSALLNNWMELTNFPSPVRNGARLPIWSGPCSRTTRSCG